MGAVETLDRIDVLLQDQDPTASRRLTSAFVKMRKAAAEPAASGTPKGAPNRDRVHYLGPRDLGDPGGFRTVISGSSRQKEMRVGVDLCLILAGESGVSAVQFHARIRALSLAWDEMVDVLQDPNNMNRASTGWLQSVSFSHAAIRPQRDRVVLSGQFVARYLREMGAL